jgi:hypothetical protein
MNKENIGTVDVGSLKRQLEKQGQLESQSPLKSKAGPPDETSPQDAVLVRQKRSREQYLTSVPGFSFSLR